MKSSLIAGARSILGAILLVVIFVGVFALALNTPVGYADRTTGRCIAVWGNNNKLSPCVSRYDERYAPEGVSTPEELSVLLGVPLSVELQNNY